MNKYTLSTVVLIVTLVAGGIGGSILKAYIDVINDSTIQFSITRTPEVGLVVHNESDKFQEAASAAPVGEY